jgi:hypothetical protein
VLSPWFRHISSRYRHGSLGPLQHRAAKLKAVKVKWGEGVSSPLKGFPAMNLLLSVIIGSVVLVFAILALAPLFLSSSIEEPVTQPRLRLIEGGKSDVHEDAA